MTTEINNSPSPLMWISSMAIVLFSGVGIAAFMGWIPTTYGSQSTVPKAAAAAASPVHKTYMHVAAISQSKVTCADCGVIESVRVINVAGKTSGIGLAGGAVAGDAIEKHSGATRTYEVIVRFDDRSRRVFNEASQPAWRSGDHVRVIDGAIRSNG